MPPPSTSQEFIALLEKSGLLDRDRIQQCLGDWLTASGDVVQLASTCVKQGLITKLQARLLLAGKYRGFIVGPYVICDEIGKGGMGAVYLAEHRTLRRRVALKVLLGDKVSQPGAVERFFREARAAAALDHRNIVRVFDVGQQGESYYLVMEYVDGKTLDKILAETGPLPWKQAAEYVAQTAAGLQHAAEQGFIHRDIKPANLMLSREGIIKILDMGLARSLSAGDDVTAIKDRDAILGTADYVSPEQAITGTALDIRSDLYSLGATFYTLLTSKPPFPGNIAQKLIHHQTTPPPRPSAVDPAIPEAISDIVVTMMAKRPEDRYQTPAEVVEALAPFRESRTGSYRSPPPSRPVISLSPEGSSRSVLSGPESLPDVGFPEKAGLRSAVMPVQSATAVELSGEPRHLSAQVQDSFVAEHAVPTTRPRRFSAMTIMIATLLVLAIIAAILAWLFLPS